MSSKPKEALKIMQILGLAAVGSQNRIILFLTSLVAQLVKNLPAMQETLV